MRRMLLATVFVLPGFSAWAQNPGVTLPDTVVSATRIPSLIETIPAGVTVIDRATIEARGYTTLIDALQAVPGLHAVQSGGPGGNASVFIRGTNSWDVLVMRNGVPINDPADPNNAFNFGVDTLADVDRIEIVRGPMSSLWGSGAVGGVINLITNKGEGKPHGSIQLGIGAPLQGQLITTLSGRTGQYDYHIDASGTDQTGFDAVPKRESVWTGTNKPYKSGTVNLELGYTPVEGTRIFGLLRGRASQFNLFELGFPTYDSQNYVGTDNTFFGEIGANTSFFNGIWESGLLVAQSGTNRHYDEPLEALDPNFTSSFSSYHGSATNLQWNNTVHLPDLGPAALSAMTFGYQHTYSSINTWINNNFGGFPYTATTKAHENADQGTLGLQSTLFNRLTLTGNIMQQGAEFGGSAFTWRFGGVLAIPEIWSHLKASYGTAFLAPSLYDLFGLDSSGFVGNPNLRPERSTGYELGWRVDVPVGARANAAGVEVTYFNNHVKDLITFQSASLFSSTVVNVNQARMDGVETSVTLNPIDWLQVVGSFTYTKAQNLATNMLLLRRPMHTGSLDVTVTPLPGLTITPEVIFSGPFMDFPVDNFGFQSFTQGSVKGGTVINLTINYKLKPNVTLFANGRNLGNSQYEPAAGYVIPGPQVLAGVRMTF